MSELEWVAGAVVLFCLLTFPVGLGLFLKHSNL